MAIELKLDPDTVKGIGPDTVHAQIVVAVTYPDGRMTHWVHFSAPGYDDVADMIEIIPNAMFAPQPPPDHQSKIAQAIHDELASPPPDTGLDYARIMGKCSTQWLEPIAQAAPGQAFSIPAAPKESSFRRLSEQEAVALIQGKTFSCVYSDPHLVDER